MMKTLSVLVLAAVCAFHPARAADPFVGTWKIANAVSLDGKPYTGQVDIKAAGMKYEVRWNTSAGKFTGVGLADGNHLGIGWGGQGSGVVSYKRGADGILAGQWAVPGMTGVGKEAATPAGKPDGFAGEYTIKGANPGGRGGYTGKLSIVKAGKVYQLTWAVPNTPAATGVGIVEGDLLQVSFSADQAMYGVVGYTFEDGTAKGTWSIRGAKETSTENLAK